MTAPRRIPHKIRPNHGTRWPRYVSFYDVESDLGPLRKRCQIFTPFLWVLDNVEYRPNTEDTLHHWRVGQDPTAFWDMLLPVCYPKTRRYVVSHHVEPDFIPLQGYTQLADRGWSLEHVYKKGITVLMRWRKATSSLVFLNNAQLMPSSIESLGDLLGLHKLAMPPRTAPLEDWITYCRRDVEIMVEAWRWLREFILEHDLGGFAPTRAGLAKHAFTHRFMPHPIYVHNHPEALALERSSYHGGRVEALQYGEWAGGPFYDLDVNSFYGYLEATFNVPTCLDDYRTGETTERLRYKLRHGGAVARVTVDLQEPIAPIQLDGAIRYPTGVHETVLTTPELLYSLAHDWSIEIHEVAYYRMRPALREFAEYFMALRAQYAEQGQGALAMFAKAYPNCLYGKFGQKGLSSTVIGECDPAIIRHMEAKDMVTGDRYAILYAGGKIKRIEQTAVAWDAFVALAAHVTAWGRIHLWDLAKQAGLHNVYHLATDALIVNAAGREALRDNIHPTRPGAVKVELAGEALSVYGKNDWQLDDVIRIKGIQKNATWLSKNTATNTEWPSLLRWLKRGIADPYFVRQRTKTLHRKDYHNATASTRATA